MSYKTNPIINRFTTNKGWKNASFPETLDSYSRNNVFLFKIFLFLKAYFAIRKIKLLSCEIRTSEEYLPILYIIINTNSRRKTKKKKFQRTFYRRYAGTKFSTLRNPMNFPALNLTFLNLFKLKSIINSNLLAITKKKTSRLWLTKPRFQTWLNYLRYLRTNRKNLYKKHNAKKFNYRPINSLSYQTKQSIQLRIIKIIQELESVKKNFRILNQQPKVIPKILNFYKKRFIKIYSKITRLYIILLKLKQQKDVTTLSNISSIHSKKSKKKKRKHLYWKDSKGYLVRYKSGRIKNKRHLIPYTKQQNYNFIKNLKWKKISLILKKRNIKNKVKIKAKSLVVFNKKYIKNNIINNIKSLLVDTKLNMELSKRLQNQNIHIKNVLRIIFNQKQPRLIRKRFHRPFILNSHKNLRKSSKLCFKLKYKILNPKLLIDINDLTNELRKINLELSNRYALKSNTSYLKARRTQKELLRNFDPRTCNIHINRITPIKSSQYNKNKKKKRKIVRKINKEILNFLDKPFEKIIENI